MMAPRSPWGADFRITTVGGGLDVESVKLLDRLMSSWSSWDSHGDYYLAELAPRISRSASFEWLPDNERPLAVALRQRLPPEQFARLADLMANRRSEVAAERERKRQERATRIEQEQEERREFARREVRRRRLLEHLRQVLTRDFLDVERTLAESEDRDHVTTDEVETLKADFARDWIAEHVGVALDEEQARAVAATSGDVRVVARAGSGKTRTIAARAVFLQKHCGVSPQEMLLLAFNRDAAREMRKRLETSLGADVPHVMTFHALAHAIVHPDEDLIRDDAAAGDLGLSREIQEVIDSHLRSPEHSHQVRDLMLAQFRDDWERIARGRFELSMDDYLAHRRSLPRETLRGEYVKSLGERVIANALFEHGVSYKYERNFRWNGTNYRPDFTIANPRGGGIVIEYFGLSGDPDYDDQSAEKRSFWAQRDEWTLIEFTANDLLRGGLVGFVEDLLGQLRLHGVKAERRSEEEIWQLIRRRAVDSFTQAMRTFVGRCRKRNLTPSELTAMALAHRPWSVAERMFLDLGVSIYPAYLSRLAAAGQADFDGLMWRSVDAVRAGQTRFTRDRGREQGNLKRVRFVMIDEFQDFSDMFHALLSAVRLSNPNARFFCVGDDWQAINGFAGSDPRYFINFSDHFRDTDSRYVRTNYRSDRAVVQVSNALMSGLGRPSTAHGLDPGEVTVCDLAGFVPTSWEQSRHPGDEITPAILRLSWHYLSRGMDVAVLTRRHGVPWYVDYDRTKGSRADALAHFEDHLRSFLPEDDRDRLSVSTVHSYKGLERSAVIVLDAVERSYPLIHPNWVFTRVFGDNIAALEAEERRLFYVALTRAKHALALVTEAQRESPYLEDMRLSVRLVPVEWDGLPPVPSVGGTMLEVRVRNAYEVRDHLKDLRYRWHSQGKYWYRAVPAEGFAFAALVSQQWLGTPVKVEVIDESGAVLHSAG